jgi:hypothetical protein
MGRHDASGAGSETSAAAEAAGPEPRMGRRRTGLGTAPDAAKNAAKNAGRAAAKDSAAVSAASRTEPRLGKSQTAKYSKAGTPDTARRAAGCQRLLAAATVV